ncbi:MAG: hypothetical protein COA62_04260 [Rhodobiaceae bacterium]|nr:MAG: hypothetical protein COA62_04260 [Rhodobiaceae bacterium]
MWNIPTDLILDALVAILLAATIFYCAMLDRRLKALRSGQDGFKAIIDQLNTATARAEMSIGQLKQASGEAGSGIIEQHEKARAVADELSVMIASGNNLADRLSQDRSFEPKMDRTDRVSLQAEEKVVSFIADTAPKPATPAKELESGLNQTLLEALKKAR